MARPRLLIATDSLDPSGVGEHMITLGTAVSADFDVTIAAPHAAAGDMLVRAARLGIAVKAFDNDEMGFTRRARFELAHIHAGIGWEGQQLVATAREAGVPRIVRTEHLPYVLTDPRQAAAYDASTAFVDRVICVSAASAASFARAGVSRRRIAVVRNGISFPAATRDRAEMREVLALAQDAPVAITVARMTEQKNHRALIAAMPQVLAHLPDLRLLLVGRGPLEHDLRVAAAQFGESVVFLGHREDVPHLLAAADLFVLPSLFEGLPLAVIEAMAAGLPVVATAIESTAEVVVNGGTGVLVEAERLGPAIVSVLKDRVAAGAMGRAARARYETHFSVARMARETSDIYRALGVGVEPKQSRMKCVDQVRIGFIGVGGIAQRHIAVLERFEDVELVAFADVSPGRAEAAALRFGARAYGTWGDLFTAGGVDAVYICVPPFAHGPIERAAIADDVPFFVEKPLALDAATAEEIARAVADKCLMTATGYHWRYLDTVEEAKRFLAERPAHLVSGYWVGETPPPQWWWRNDRSGGQMVEQTTHILDLVRYLVGDVVEVYALAGHTARSDFPDLDVATVSTASLKFASGAVGTIGSTCLLNWNHRIGLHLYGEGFAIELSEHDIMIDVGAGRPRRSAGGDPVWLENRDFVDAIKGGENRVRSPYCEAIRTHRLTMAIAQSAKSGVPVVPQRESAHG